MGTKRIAQFHVWTIRYVFVVYLKIDLKHFSKVYKKCKYDDGDDDDGNVQLPPAVATSQSDHSAVGAVGRVSSSESQVVNYTLWS